MSRAEQNRIARTVDEFLAAQQLPVEPEHDCPYLPGRQARNEGFAIGQLPFHIYQALMNRGFRRSGEIVYRPVCDDCRMCRQLRVPVETFKPTRSQRRVWRMNQDIEVAINERPEPTQRKWELFRAYIDAQHDASMPSDYDDFERFLYDSPTKTIEIQYRVGGRAVGISIADRGAAALSSVYMFFDPSHSRRSLGTFSVLWEIDYCRRKHIPHYYMGYYVAGSKTMDYKARFLPHEILADDGSWQTVSHASDEVDAAGG